jgi:hypothetical protein
LFILLASGGLTEVEIFGVKASKFSLFLLAIPVAVSFVFARTVGLLATISVYEYVYHEVLRATCPPLAASGLGMLPLGRVNSWGIAELDRHLFEAGTSRRISLIGTYLETGFAFLAPIAFGIYAYGNLFVSAETPTWAVSVSLALTVLLIVYGFFVNIYIGLRLVGQDDDFSS